MKILYQVRREEKMTTKQPRAIYHSALGNGRTACGLDMLKVAISNMPDCVHCLREELKEFAPTKHTPGPWIVDYQGTKGHIKAVNGKKDSRGFDQTPTVAKYDCFSEFRPMGDVSISEEEEKANARLIASAPELLEALKTALNLIHTDDSIHAEITMIQQAIAKAEGRE
jgi:hypothetical protein